LLEAKETGFLDWREFSVHNVRKTFETWLIALGVSPFVVFKHCGHSPGCAFRRYIFNVPDNPEVRWEIRKILGGIYYKLS
jgi:hypothetical protein